MARAFMYEENIVLYVDDAYLLPGGMACAFMYEENIEELVSNACYVVPGILQPEYQLDKEGGSYCLAEAGQLGRKDKQT